MKVSVHKLNVKKQQCDPEWWLSISFTVICKSREEGVEDKSLSIKEIWRGIKKSWQRTYISDAKSGKIGLTFWGTILRADNNSNTYLLLFKSTNVNWPLVDLFRITTVTSCTWISYDKRMWNPLIKYKLKTSRILSWWMFWGRKSQDLTMWGVWWGWQEERERMKEGR